MVAFLIPRGLSYTADMKRAETFYTDILGLKVVESKLSFVTL